MVVTGEIRIEGTLDEVWAVVSRVDQWASVIKGVQRIEVLARPAEGLSGLRWKETRLLFEKPETVEKWVTEYRTGDFFTAQATQDGLLFTTTLRMVQAGTGVHLASIHRTEPMTLSARLRTLPLFLFKDVIRKALVEDLRDLKVAAEQGPQVTR